MRFLLCLVALTFTAWAELKTDIEFARPGGVSLTLDAFVPEGDGPFSTCILVHGGGFTKGDKTSFIKPLFAPLSEAKFTWFTINYRLAPAHRFPANIEDAEAAIRWVKAHATEYKVDVVASPSSGSLRAGTSCRSSAPARRATPASRRWFRSTRRMIWNCR
jgi:acetyl esterase